MKEEWTTIIKPKTRLFDFHFKELWQYRDLVLLFVKRNFTSSYKQTILGPLWLLINPVLSTFLFTVVFGNIAKISTDGTPGFLFYMAGNILWICFSSCLTATASTFTANRNVFGKVYFPRFVTPISTAITDVIKFAIQFFLFLLVLCYFAASGANVHPNVWVLLTPALLLQTMLLAVGCGSIISSLTTKYRDLGVLVSFGVQLWMYATPVVYPVSQIEASWRPLMLMNPMAPIVETFRFAFLGSGSIPYGYLAVSFLVSFLVFFFGLILFNRIERTFMDTV